MHLTFKAFRAINEPELCEGFKQGHRNVLLDYGIANITTNTNEWHKNPNMYCVIAIDNQTKQIVGGIRVQISDKQHLLPVEAAIGKMDKKIHEIVNQFREDGGVGELCALWNAKSVAGIGISVLLTRAGISITNQLTIKTLMGICADYTLKMFQQVGFVVEKNLGTNGEFPYPNANYTARVLGIMNAASLDTAAEYDKQRMSDLRMNPVQSATEREKMEVRVDYQLIVSL